MIILQHHGHLLASVLLSAVRQHLFADSGTESTAEPSGLEQAMIPQQAMMKDAISPHAPSPLSADADATVTGTDMSAGGLCRIRRMSALRSTRQDAQINYMSTLSIFMKQTTYLATLPNFVEFRDLITSAWH